MPDKRVLIYGPLKLLPLECFSRGIALCGERVAYRNHSVYKPGEAEKCHVAVTFGVKYPCDRIIEDYKARGVPTIVMDMGYVRRGNLIAAGEDPAGVYWSAGVGGLNGNADFRNERVPGDRWEALKAPLSPWRKSGTHILLCSQTPNDAAVGDMNPRLWAVQVVERLKKLTSRPILYRPHPQDPTPRSIKGVAFSQGKSLEEDLEDAWAMVAWNSNALVSSVIVGVPVFALGPGSMVEAVANKSLEDIESPMIPDRQQWAHSLAYCQWSCPELEAGLAWRHLILRETKSVDEPALESNGEEGEVYNLKPQSSQQVKVRIKKDRKADFQPIGEER